jgi:hypothetical protein
MDMDDEEEQQDHPAPPPPPPLPPLPPLPARHEAIADAIARLEDPLHAHERHILKTGTLRRPGLLYPYTCQNLEDLVDLLDNHVASSPQAIISQLELDGVVLVGAFRGFTLPDGGLEVLKRFFARSDTTLTCVSFDGCAFGGRNDHLQILEAFYQNRTVSELRINDFSLREGDLENVASGVMQNMPQLQRLHLKFARRFPAARASIMAFLSALQANRTLRELYITCSLTRDEGYSPHLQCSSWQHNHENIDYPRLQKHSCGFGRCHAATRVDAASDAGRLQSAIAKRYKGYPTFRFDAAASNVNGSRTTALDAPMFPGGRGQPDCHTQYRPELFGTQQGIEPCR